MWGNRIALPIFIVQVRQLQPKRFILYRSNQTETQLNSSHQARIQQCFWSIRNLSWEFHVFFKVLKVFFVCLFDTDTALNLLGAVQALHLQESNSLNPATPSGRSLSFAITCYLFHSMLTLSCLHMFREWPQKWFHVGNWYLYRCIQMLIPGLQRNITSYQ